MRTVFLFFGLCIAQLSWAQYPTGDACWGTSGFCNNTNRSWFIMNKIIPTFSNKYLIIGTNGDMSGHSSVSLMKFTQDGKVDTNFGDSGWGEATIFRDQSSLSDDWCTDGVELISGKTFLSVVKGRGTKWATVLGMRVGIGGSLDNTFGDGGVVEFPYAPRPYSKVLCAVQPDQKVFLAFSYTDTLQIMRLDLEGRMDSSFAVNGILQEKLRDSLALKSILFDHNKLWIAGNLGLNKTTGKKAYIARYNIDGSADTSFFHTGYFESDLAKDSLNLGSLVKNPNGDVFLAGIYYHADTSNAFVLKISQNDEIDSLFSNGNHPFCYEFENNSQRCHAQWHPDNYLLLVVYTLDEPRLVSLSESGTVNWEYSLWRTAYTGNASALCISNDKSLFWANTRPGYSYSILTSRILLNDTQIPTVCPPPPPPYYSPYLYPIPSSSNVYLDTEKEVKSVSVQLWDMNGKLLSEASRDFVIGQNKLVDLSEYQSGLYILQIRQGDSVRTEKIQKN